MLAFLPAPPPIPPVVLLNGSRGNEEVSGLDLLVASGVVLSTVLLGLLIGWLMTRHLDDRD